MPATGTCQDLREAGIAMPDMHDLEEQRAEIRRLHAELRELRERAARAAAEPDDDERPRRMTLSDVVAGLLAAQSKHGGERSLVRLVRNAKGDTQIEVAVRTGDSTGVETVDDCSAEAVRVYDALRIIYPMVEGPSS